VDGVATAREGELFSHRQGTPWTESTVSTTDHTDVDRAWWKESFVYQIYPQSFNDSSGDGVGDIRGIIERLDYLDDLGVDVVWVNPLYDSPHVDDGYDIRDYRAIREAYGTMSDFEELLDEMHARDMRLVMDLVVNHTSAEHVWFQRSREATDDHADYYWWHEGRQVAEDGGVDATGETDDGGTVASSPATAAVEQTETPPGVDRPDPTERPGPDDRLPPNNWESGFSGSAWAWDDEREAYYLHLFDESQPDLRWETEAVREDVYDMINWWLEKGIDGFRMDVFNLLSKPPALPDGDPTEGWVGSEHFANGPRIHEYVSEMVDRTFSNHDVMTVGEAIDAGTEEAKRYCGPSGDGLDMVFHYEHMTLDFDEEEGWWAVDPWDLPDLREIFSRWQRELADDDAWNTLFFGTHDWPRIVSRWGDDGAYRRESAKLLATLLFTLRGTPFVYQGDEIGMTNYPWSSLDELADADATTRVRNRIASGEVDGFDDVRDLVRYRCRDNARTPMQWSDEEHAGFTDGDPWLAVNPNHESINVEAARRDHDSVWHHYRDLVDLRDEDDLLVYGDYHLLTDTDPQVWAYARTLGDEAALVVLNWSDESAAYDPTGDLADVTALDDDAGSPEDRTLVLSNYDDELAGGQRGLSLRPYEARVYELS
jgi:glycosidase